MVRKKKVKHDLEAGVYGQFEDEAKIDDRPGDDSREMKDFRTSSSSVKPQVLGHGAS